LNIVPYCLWYCVIVDIILNSPYLRRRQFGQGHRKIRRKPGTSGSSGWLGVELMFAGLVVKTSNVIQKSLFCYFSYAVPPIQ